MDNVIGKMRNWGLLGMILCLLVACQDDWSSENIPDQGQMVNLMGRLQQQNESRANDAGFVDGDRMGIYMVDYVNGQPGGLSSTDNRATNVLYTFNAAVNKWESATALYWKDKTTPADFYGWRAVFRRKVCYKNQRNPGSAKPAFLPFFVANAEKIRMPTFPQIQLAYQLQLYYNKQY